MRRRKRNVAVHQSNLFEFFHYTEFIDDDYLAMAAYNYPGIIVYTQTYLLVIRIQHIH